MQNLKDRLIQFAKDNGLSMRAFEEECELGRGNINNMKPTASIGSDKLSKIIDRFPDVDLLWLITGRYSKKTEPSSESSQLILINKIAEQAEEIGRLKQRIIELERNARRAPNLVSVSTPHPDVRHAEHTSYQMVEADITHAAEP